MRCESDVPSSVDLRWQTDYDSTTKISVGVIICPVRVGQRLRPHSMADAVMLLPRKNKVNRPCGCHPIPKLIGSSDPIRHDSTCVRGMAAALEINARVWLNSVGKGVCLSSLTGD